jgi:amino acid transporter
MDRNTEMQDQDSQDPPEDKSQNGTGEEKRNGKEPEQINVDLTRQELRQGPRAGDKYVRVLRPYGHLFQRIGPGTLRVTEEVLKPTSFIARSYAALKRVLVGQPLPTHAEIHERLSKVKALAVFSSDAISSVAYATGEIMFVLVLAGSAALPYAESISIAIAVLLSIVAFSYRQTVFAYPNGGGSYIVSRANIGTLAGLIAAAALLIDYTLTVAVSISAGTDAITSAFPALMPWDVEINLIFIGLITLGNLRGIRESGTIFAIPTYMFILTLGALILAGVVEFFFGAVTPIHPAPIPAQEPLTLWLLLNAFSAGSVAASGTEAISNGVPAFKPPESKNAATTLTVMAAILGVFFLGISFLAVHYQVDPTSTQTIISQLGHAIFGNNVFYYLLQFTTMAILVLAANTSFADFPRLSSILARDNFMPHQFAFRGDRLAFSVGIVALGGIAGALIVIFGGDTHALIPLYAVGVFLAFTMSQSGMVLHWWRSREHGWRRNMVINGVGAFLTLIVLVIAGSTKFVHGAWLVLIFIPTLVVAFSMIHRHYSHVAEQLRVVPEQVPPVKVEHFVLIPIHNVDRASLRALAYARTLSPEVVVLHVGLDEEHTKQVRAKLARFAPDVKFVVLESPYRAFVRPLVTYIEALHRQRQDAFVTIVLPEFIPAHWWERFLHNRAANRLRAAFEREPNVAVVLVPFQLKR